MTATKEETKTPEQENQVGEIQCHSLPCKVDFSGRAPVEVYFSPQIVGEDRKLEEKKDQIYSAHFRGRQLLAAEPYLHSSPTAMTTEGAGAATGTDATTHHRMQGRLLEIDACKPRTSEDKIKVKATFGSILEWKHECEPVVVRNTVAAVDHTSRVRTALEWCDVAHAVRTDTNNIQ